MTAFNPSVTATAASSAAAAQAVAAQSVQTIPAVPPPQATTEKNAKTASAASSSFSSTGTAASGAMRQLRPVTCQRAIVVPGPFHNFDVASGYTYHYEMAIYINNLSLDFFDGKILPIVIDNSCYQASPEVMNWYEGKKGLFLKLADELASLYEILNRDEPLLAGYLEDIYNVEGMIWSCERAKTQKDNPKLLDLTTKEKALEFTKSQNLDPSRKSEIVAKREADVQAAKAAYDKFVVDVDKVIATIREVTPKKFDALADVQKKCDQIKTEALRYVEELNQHYKNGKIDKDKDYIPFPFVAPPMKPLFDVCVEALNKDLRVYRFTRSNWNLLHSNFDEWARSRLNFVMAGANQSTNSQ